MCQKFQSENIVSVINSVTECVGRIRLDGWALASGSLGMGSGKNETALKLLKVNFYQDVGRKATIFCNH